MNEYKNAINIVRNAILKDGVDYGKLHAILEMCIGLLRTEPTEREYVFKWTKYVKDCCQSLHISTTQEEYGELYWQTMLFEAQNRVLDSYLLYLERKRDRKDRFYEPRRRCFIKIGLIQALQDMLDDKLDILSISLPPGTGKSTIEKFFHSGVCGWFPSDYNLFYSHSGDITRMYYDGIYDILTNSDEYTWNDIFPNCKVTNTNAKLEQLNINKYKPFPNVQCTSVGAKNAGKVRASKFLLCDDLIGGIEEALNKNRLDGLWSVYSVDARQRKITGCKEIHIATRWSVHDVIGRLQRLYDGDERCKFIAIPDIDPETGESNFAFDRDPFTVEFYNDQAKLMDEVSYRCLYKNEPIEREGLLYTEDSLRRYFNLPDGIPDEIEGQCDAKGKGTDFMVMPCFYRYGDDYYMDDVVCSKEPDYEMQYTALVNLIIRNKMQNAEFESNMGGDRVAEETNKRVTDAGWICNITTKATESNKEARIYQTANWVKQHILFKDKSLYEGKSDYGVFMSQLLSYSVSGKNPNDDVPDVLANHAIKKTGAGKTAIVEVWSRGRFGI